MRNLIDKIDSNKRILILLMIFGTFFLVWRVRFGYCFDDEPFIITLAKRIDDGGALIVHEWHGVQNFGSIVLPFYKLFHIIFGKSNNGILLYFRYIYAFYWSSVCTYIGYFFYKKYSSVLCGMLPYLYLLLFAPLEQNTFSYTSVGLGCALLLCCLIYNIYVTDNNKMSIFYYIAFCTLTIIFVLCLPFMAVAYVGLFIISNIICIKSNNKGMYNLRKYINASIPAISIIALIYVYRFVFSKVSLNQILSCIPYILNDPEHGKISLFKSLYRLNQVLIMNYGIYCGLIFIASIILLNKHLSENNKIFIFSICSLSYFIYQFLLARHINNNNHMNFQVLLISFLGLIVYLMLENKPKLEFNIFFLMSVIYTILDYMSTDTALMAVSMTASVFGCFTLVMLVLLYKEKHNSISILILIGLILSIQFSTEIFFKLYRQYWDKPLYTMSEKINVGACKGLYTCKENKLEYEEMYNSLSFLIKEYSNDDSCMLSLCSKPVIYLDSDTNIGCFSTWSLRFGDLFTERQDNYSIISGIEPDIILGYTQKDPMYDVKYNIPAEYRRINYNKAYIFIK